MGRAAREGNDRGERGLRGRLGDRRRPAADHGAPPRAGSDRSARRPGRERVRARALRAPVPPERRDRGAARQAVRPAPRAGREGTAGDQDHRRLRRRDQRGVSQGGASHRPVDAERRGRGRRPDRCGLRRRRGRRGPPLAVPRPPPAQARPGDGPARAGRISASATIPRRAWPSTGRVVYDSASSSEIGNVVVDFPAAAPASTLSTTTNTTRLPMSNALLVGAKRSATGKPLFVAGPQVGQYYPQIMLELDLDGGGYRARGAAFPGISFGILLGRGIRLRVERDVRRLRPGRPVRRNALRWERHDVPVPRRLPSDDDVRRRDDRRAPRRARPAARLPRDRARPRARVRDGRWQEGRDLGASARRTAGSSARSASSSTCR